MYYFKLHRDRAATIGWSRPTQVSAGLRWAASAVTLVIAATWPAVGYSQLGGLGGGIGVGGGGGGGIRVGGGGGGRPGVSAGGATRAQVRAPNVGANVGNATRAAVRAPGAGAAVRGNVGAAVNPNIPGARARAGAAAGAAVRSNTGAGANLDAAVRAANANVRVANKPVIGANAPGINVNAAAPGARANAGAAGANLGANLNAGAASRAAARANLPGAALNAATGIGANANVRANLGSPRWRAGSAAQLGDIRTNLGAALAPNVVASVGMNNWFANHPQRASVWGGWGNRARGNFFVGNSPYFGGSPFLYGQDFWSGRNLIGLGLTSAGYGRLGAAVGGYPAWWGYSPWAGYHPYSHWWGTPTWGGVCGWFPNYGWTQPCYYDYGYGGNVVYQDDYVYVNGQNVGTTSEYAQTAAELAAIDPNAISQTAPEDWLPLGTFSMSITPDEANPPRVIQLAVNKQGLVSGTVYNRNSDKLYTVQGRVDQDTQRVAFTIGEQTDTVLETGVYNLTQEQTPVLVHYGPDQTATYLFARLPNPEPNAQTTQSANANVNANQELGINR